MVQRFTDSIHIGDTFLSKKCRYSCGKLGSTLIYNVTLTLCCVIIRFPTTRSNPNCFCFLRIKLSYLDCSYYGFCSSANISYTSQFYVTFLFFCSKMKNTN